MVDYFGIKYLVKEHALHLKAALEIKYRVTMSWKGQLYIRIAIQWDYEKGTVQLSMPGYVRAELYSFQHKKPKQPQDSPYP